MDSRGGKGKGGGGAVELPKGRKVAGDKTHECEIRVVVLGGINSYLGGGK